MNNTVKIKKKQWFITTNGTICTIIIFMAISQKLLECFQ